MSSSVLLGCSEFSYASLSIPHFLPPSLSLALALALSSSWATIHIGVASVPGALHSGDANSCIMAFPRVHLHINTGLSGLLWLA